MISRPSQAWCRSSPSPAFATTTRSARCMAVTPPRCWIPRWDLPCIRCCRSDRATPRSNSRSASSAACRRTPGRYAVKAAPSTSAVAPRPRRRGSPTPRAVCSHMRRPRVWFSKSPGPTPKECSAANVTLATGTPRTGFRCPSVTNIPRELRVPTIENAKPVTVLFEDDGLVPNNVLPFVIYKSAIAVDNASPEAEIEKLFAANGWGDMWRNGVYDFLHYHATVHEALGIARGHARVRFGGDRGKEFELDAGDVAILPAGTGHQCLRASDDFSVVGAYPPGEKMQVTQPTPENHVRALKTIPEVALPDSDPLLGRDGPLVKLWKRA